MARLVEFIVPGQPVLSDAPDRPRLEAWRERVQVAAKAAWPRSPLPSVELYLHLTHYVALPVGEEACAPECRAIAHLIVDALQGIVYTHRNQVIARICIRQNVNRPFRIRDLSVPLARGLTQGGEFVHVIFDSRYREELTTVPEGDNDRPAP